MFIQVILPIETVKGLIVPLMVAVSKSLPFCTSESAENLLIHNSELWALIEESEEDEGGVDITLLYFEMQVAVARLCSIVHCEQIEDQERCWSYIMAGYKLFDSAVSSYINKEAKAVREEMASDNSEGLTFVSPSKKVLH